MDLSKESKATQNLYGIGTPTTDDFGRQCLLARRFAEAMHTASQARQLLNFYAALARGTDYAASLGVNISQMTKVSDNLYIQDVTAGAGAQATIGKSVNVKYTGWLVNGTQFDSNTIAFPLGVGAVIPGWDLGLVGMRAGGTRRLVIGSALAYGSGGNPPAIPGNATLVFVVQLQSAQ